MYFISVELQEKLRKIKMLIMDVDGTLTDGKIYLGNDGEELKAFNVKDGLGINLLHREGIIPAIITGRKSEIVNIRARELRIEEVYQGVKDKLAVYKHLKEKYGLQIAYVGDDLNDLPIMEEVSLPSGWRQTQERCDYCASKNGGEGRAGDH